MCGSCCFHQVWQEDLRIDCIGSTEFNKYNGNKVDDTVCLMESLIYFFDSLDRLLKSITSV